MKKPNRHPFPTFFFLVFLFQRLHGDSPMAQEKNRSGSVEVFDVGVILDMETAVGKMSMSCISMALSDFYSTHNYSTRLVLHTRDSEGDNVAAASAALDLLKNVEVQAIIGPQKSGQAKFVADLGDKAQVPIISSSATSPSLSSTRNPFFIRTAPNDSVQAKAIASVVQTFGWRQVIPIYDDTEYATGMIPCLIDAFQDIDTEIPFRSVVSISAKDDQILQELYKLMTMQTRVFVVHMSFSLGVRFILKAKEVGLISEGYAWIVTDGMMNLLDSADSSVIASMQGVLGVKPYSHNTEMLDNFAARWRRQFHQENPNMDRSELNILGLWAYDTVWSLAMAVERMGAAKFDFQMPEIGENSTDLASLKVSLTGPRLRRAILTTRFEGLAGKFNLVDGELQQSTLQIVNVIGKGEREIGFWRPGHGISRILNTKRKKTQSDTNIDLSPVIWPGETMAVPKGWVLPVNGKKLKIGVPVKDSYHEFVKVERDPLTNRKIISGFCIDVFNAVMEALPYAVPYELVPFEGADGHMAGSYNDLVYQVYLQNYDGVAGDTTIRANRSKYVDFTLPYSETGVAMVVPVKHDEKTNAWVFLKPLTWGLWVATGGAFIFTGLVVWVLEHWINEDFQGSCWEQVGVVLWFCFSTLVFAHKENIVNNLTRLVLIIWMFVVLILTSSYTASLTSMLTVQRLQPTVTDVAELIRNGDYVGYQKNSFVEELLLKMNFDASKLRPFTTVEQFNEALSKGSRNGGVAAVFHEIPYFKLFLAKFCNKYIVVGPTHKTPGFGFVFPKGSPLVRDVSKAIIEVKEAEKMVTIEDAWFGRQPTCPDQSASMNSNSLTFDSFRGLFLITGIAWIVALVGFVAYLVCKYRHVFMDPNSEDSTWKRFTIVAKNFPKKDRVNLPTVIAKGNCHCHCQCECKTTDDSLIGEEVGEPLAPISLTHTPQNVTISSTSDSSIASSSQSE